MTEFSYVPNSMSQHLSESVVSEWTDFVEFLAEEATKPKPATHTEKKYNTPALTGAIWRDGETDKTKFTAEYTKLHALDLDYTTIPIEEWQSMLDDLGWYYIIHSTTFSTNQEPRYRIILPFDRRVLRDEWQSVFHAIESIFGEQMDRRTRNINRLFYLPYKWILTDAFHYFSYGGHSGLPIDELKNLYPYTPTSSPVQSEMNNLDYPYQYVDIWDNSFCGQLMVEKYRNRSRGGRMWSFLCGVAFKAQQRGYMIRPDDLEIMAWQFNDLLSRKDSRPNMREEVEKAITTVWSGI